MKSIFKPELLELILDATAPLSRYNEEVLLFNKGMVESVRKLYDSLNTIDKLMTINRNLKDMIINDSIIIDGEHFRSRRTIRNV